MTDPSHRQPHRAFACQLALAACLVAGQGCSGGNNATAAQTHAPGTATPRAVTQEADPEAPVRAARAFMTAIIAADRAGWAPLARPPVAWNRRCAWQQDEAAVDRVVRSQRPPPGVVAVQSARILAKVDPAANTRAADAHRALADLATTCGSPSLDAPLGALRGLAHRFVLVQLRTPDGPHPVVLRLTRVGGDWRVTGLIG